MNDPFPTVPTEVLAHCAVKAVVAIMPHEYRQLSYTLEVLHRTGRTDLIRRAFLTLRLTGNGAPLWRWEVWALFWCYDGLKPDNPHTPRRECFVRALLVVHHRDPLVQEPTFTPDVYDTIADRYLPPVASWGGGID